jgi:predicted transglutaminase-like cysteine proteinase
MLQRDGVVMVVMKVLVMVMMMISMKSSSMAMTMATISPLWEGISLADFCRRAFSLYVFSAPQRRWSLSRIPLS